MAIEICESVRELLDAYADGEVDAVLAQKIEVHIENCADCKQLLRLTEDTKAAVRSSAMYYAAPKKLEQSIRTAVRKEARQSRSFPKWGSQVLFGGGIFAVGAIAALLIVGQGSADREFADVVVDSHVRSLVGTHLLDVVSTDKHTVKPWFAGKIDYAFDVDDFASQGFPLLGGRVDFLNHREVAVLVYGHGKHVINVYVAPSGELPRLSETTIRGFRTLEWTKQGNEFLAISDMDQIELLKFKSLEAE